MGLPKTIATQLGDKTSFWSKITRNRSDEYYQTLAFVREFKPGFFSIDGVFNRVPFISRALSYIPKVGGMFEPPNTFEKLTSGVNLSVAFDEKVIGSRQQAQKLFDSLGLDNYSVKGAVTGFKPRKTITVKQFTDLKEAAESRHLDYSSMRKVIVTDSSLMRKNGKPLDLNPMKNNKIAGSKIVSTGDNLPDKLEKILNKFPDDQKHDVLKKFDFKKVNMGKDAFEKLEALASKHNLDVFKDLKVSPNRLRTRPLSTQQFANLVIEAVQNNQPLDMKCVDLRRVDLSKALQAARQVVGAEIMNIKLEASEFRGAKMTVAQKQRLDKAFDARNAPRIDDKEVSIKKLVHRIKTAAKFAGRVIKAAFTADLATAPQGQVLVAPANANPPPLPPTSTTSIAATNTQIPPAAAAAPIINSPIQPQPSGTTYKITPTFLTGLRSDREVVGERTAVEMARRGRKTQPVIEADAEMTGIPQRQNTLAIRTKGGAKDLSPEAMRRSATANQGQSLS